MDCSSISDVPLVLFAADTRGKVRVTACSLAARRRGVVPGMLLAEAQSLLPAGASCFEPYDPHADREALRQLALAGLAFSPWVAVDDAERPDGLLLDVTGCGYGFGGEAGLAAAAVAEMRRHGYWTTAAIADTAGAAWAVAHYGIALRPNNTQTRIVPPGRTAEALRPLPTEALRLRPDAVALLHEFDLRQIGQVMTLRRAELPSRFGPELLQRLDQALGSAPEVLTPERPVKVVKATWPFEPPVADGQVLETVIGRLLENVLEQLRPQQLGVQQLLFTLMLEDHAPLRFPVELLRPTRSLRHLTDLVRLHLERQTIPAAVAGVAVRAERVGLLEFRQGLLFDGDGADRWRQVTGLLERLSSRLGEKAVLRPHLRADAQPEFAYRCEPCFLSNSERGTWSAEQLSTRSHSPPWERTVFAAPRRGGATQERRNQCVPTEDCGNEEKCPLPPCLRNRPGMVAVATISDDPPARFHWGGDQYIVSQSWGPERIETGWWRGADVRRDYFLVETTAGERFWLFRSLADGAWFLHGVFA